MITPLPSACPNTAGVKADPGRARHLHHLAIWRWFKVNSISCMNPDDLVCRCHDLFGTSSVEPLMPHLKADGLNALPFLSETLRLRPRPASCLRCIRRWVRKVVCPLGSWQASIDGPSQVLPTLATAPSLPSVLGGFLPPKVVEQRQINAWGSREIVHTVRLPNVLMIRVWTHQKHQVVIYTHTWLLHGPDWKTWDLIPLPRR